jgi:hypothetical protein
LQRTESKEYSEYSETPLTKIQDDVNKILLKLDELSLGKAKTDVGSTKETVSIDDIKAANNNMELITSDKLEIKMLNDGCKITCNACMEYMKANPYMKMKVKLMTTFYLV